MPKKRHVKIFRSGRNQAIRIPREWEFNCEEATTYRDGDRLVVEPVRKGGLLNMLASLEPIETPFPNIDDSLRPVDEVKL